MEAEDRYERIGGTATGGGTFWGLGKLLTKAKVGLLDSIAPSVRYLFFLCIGRETISSFAKYFGYKIHTEKNDEI